MDLVGGRNNALAGFGRSTGLFWRLCIGLGAAWDGWGFRLRWGSAKFLGLANKYFGFDVRPRRDS